MKNDDTNIIRFPKQKMGTPANIQTREDLLTQITDYKLSFAEDIAEILSNHVFGELARSNANFGHQIDDLFPSMLLVTESIQSLHLKSSGVYHPLQDFADDLFCSDDDDDNEMSDTPPEVLYDDQFNDGEQ